MQYRTLGRTGLTVSEVGVGGAQFGLTNYMGPWDAFSDEAQRATTATIQRALDLGYNYFDTAPGYGNGRSEEMVGHAIQGHRDQVTRSGQLPRILPGTPLALAWLLPWPLAKRAAHPLAKERRVWNPAR